jgi:hypothetical protein
VSRKGRRGKEERKEEKSEKWGMRKESRKREG